MDSRVYFDFMGNKKIMFAISAVLRVAAYVILLPRVERAD